jgi:hypothetical protein
MLRWPTTEVLSLRLLTARGDRRRHAGHRWHYAGDQDMEKPRQEQHLSKAFVHDPFRRMAPLAGKNFAYVCGFIGSQFVLNRLWDGLMPAPKCCDRYCE